MKTNNIYILGAGNMARETFYIYKDLKRDKFIRAFIVEKSKEDSNKNKMLYGKPILNAEEIDKISPNSIFIGAIGSSKRKRWITELEKRGFQFDTAIHPSVSLWESVDVSPGCIISKGVVLTIDIKIGKHTILNLNSNINHDCTLGDFVTIGPGVHIGGNVTIGEGTWIGIGTTIIHNITIGKDCFIAAGAVVVNDIPDNTLAIGVPAKPVRKIKENDWKRMI